MSVAPKLIALVTIAVAFGTATAQAQYRCTVKTVNNVPGAVIEQIDVQFYFSDGTGAYVQRDTELEAGDASYIDSNTDEKCTKSVSVVATVEYGGDTIPVIYNTGDAGADQCWINVPIELNASFLVKHMDAKERKTPGERFAAITVINTIDPKTGKPVVRKVEVTEDREAYIEAMKKRAK